MRVAEARTQDLYVHLGFHRTVRVVVVGELALSEPGPEALIRLDVHREPRFREAMEAVRAGGHDLVLVGPSVGSRSGLEFLAALESQRVRMPIVLAGPRSDRRTELHAMALGAMDYVDVDDCASDEIERIVRRTTTRSRRAGESVDLDGLTGVDALASFKRKLRRMVRNGLRAGKKSALFLIDIENFTRINEELGLEAGDDVLKALGDRLVSFGTREDLVGRVDADVFAIALYDPPRNIRRAIEVLRTRLCEPIMAGFEFVSIEVAMGVSISPEDGRFAEELLDRADALLAQAKYEPERYAFAAGEASVDRRRRETLLDEFSKARDEDQIRMVYQPQVMGSGRVLRSFEALCRWTHPRLGVVSPGEFVPLLETAGRSYELDRWVIHRAMADRARWQAMGLEPPLMAINVSAQSLREHRFVGEVVHAIELNRQQPEDIEVEMTETCMLDPGADQALRQLSRLGIRLAIDDFGTGYAALGTLAHSPANLVKLDRSLVAEVGEKSRDGMLVTGIVRLARELGLEVLAEGVETEGQHQFLRGAQVDSFQGWLFSRPLEFDDASTYLENRAAAATDFGADRRSRGQRARSAPQLSGPQELSTDI
ncbi:MAG: EAL domain-containing protein [Myxococcota bacterium]